MGKFEVIEVSDREGGTIVIGNLNDGTPSTAMHHDNKTKGIYLTVGEVDGPRIRFFNHDGQAILLQSKKSESGLVISGLENETRVGLGVIGDDEHPSLVFTDGTTNKSFGIHD